MEGFATSMPSITFFLMVTRTPIPRIRPIMNYEIQIPRRRRNWLKIFAKSSWDFCFRKNNETTKYFKLNLIMELWSRQKSILISTTSYNLNKKGCFRFTSFHQRVIYPSSPTLVWLPSLSLWSSECLVTDWKPEFIPGTHFNI